MRVSPPTVVQSAVPPFQPASLQPQSPPVFQPHIGQEFLVENEFDGLFYTHKVLQHFPLPNTWLVQVGDEGQRILSHRALVNYIQIASQLPQH